MKLSFFMLFFCLTLNAQSKIFIDSVSFFYYEDKDSVKEIGLEFTSSKEVNYLGDDDFNDLLFQNLRSKIKKRKLIRF